MNGIKVSSVSGRKVVSSGGGIPINSLILLKSDRLTGYSDLLLKYYLSQGLAIKNPNDASSPINSHHILLASSDESPSQLLSELMGLANISANESSKEDDGDEEVDVLGNVLVNISTSQRTLGAMRGNKESEDKMQIAWRYQSQSKVSSELVNPESAKSSNTVNVKGSATAGFRKGVKAGDTVQQVSVGPFSHIFDISKRMDLSGCEERIACVDLQFEEDKMDHLYTEIENKLKSDLFNLNKPSPSTLRIAIHAFGSLSWTNAKLDQHKVAELFRFLHSLKTLISGYSACCMVTIPAYLYGKDQQRYIKRLEYLADACIEVESLSGTLNEVNPAYTALKYHGLLHTIKLPFFNASVMTPLEKPGGSDRRVLAFKCRRKRFAIEVIQIPVEDEEVGKDNKVSAGGSGKKIEMGCGTVGGGNAPLDF
ncbi:Elongator subunit elp4 [Nowakowskiella sp. JEL0407]|nr:Elongator subunit elp4 [Nowakowskiella sp. JEL0407]